MMKGKIIKLLIAIALATSAYALYWTPKASENDIVNIDNVERMFTIWNKSQLDKIFKLSSCTYSYSQCHYESTRGGSHGYEALYTLSNDGERAILAEDDKRILKKQNCRNVYLRFSKFEDDPNKLCESSLFRMNTSLVVFVVDEESQLIEYYRGWAVIVAIIGLFVFSSIWNAE
jgi:hypothetical protein